MKSIYQALISPARIRPSAFPERDLETNMLSDKTRIVTSSAFRRLQTKAQVFSLERNASVRTRLTHTLEVAMFGELIAGKVFTLSVEKGLIDDSLRVPFIKTVENACLLHDIGNPPFGHLGEFAIRDWFFKAAEDLKGRWASRIADREVENHYDSFRYFDGNPQGLRIVARLQWLRDEYGLNLTCTLLATMMKYLGTRPSQARPFAKKIGFFETERTIVGKVWKTLGLPLEAGDGDPLSRHPLAFLMEAADDIAYCVSDIEDAIEKEIVTDEAFFDQLEGDLKKYIPDHKPVMASKNSRFIDFRVGLTRNLVETAARVYVERAEEILAGQFGIPLLEVDDEAKAYLNQLKDFSRKHIFTSREAVEVELSGFKVVQTLLEGFRRLFFLSTDQFTRLLDDRYGYGEMALERRLLSLLPNKHVLVYRHQVDAEPLLEPILRAHLLVDYISGMTDSHAVKIFNMLTGASAGVTL